MKQRCLGKLRDVCLVRKQSQLMRRCGTHRYDASWSTSKSNQIRTRIYVTSESHVHTIVNALAESVGAAAASSSDCSPPPQSNDDQIHAVAAHELDEDEDSGADAGRTLLSSGAKTLISATPELDYLTHIVFRVYENPTVCSDC